MTLSHDLAERIWNGDKTAVPEVRQLFENQKASALDYLCALYSLRRYYAEELVRHSSLLSRCAAHHFATAKSVVALEEWAQDADALATYCEWVARQPGVLRDYDRGILQYWAAELCKRIVAIAPALSREDPSPILARLTEVRLFLQKPGDEEAVHRLHELLAAVESLVGGVGDAKQRVRICAKLGLLMRRTPQRWWRGLYWGLRACLVPKVPRNVRFKALAALSGIDR